MLYAIVALVKAIEELILGRRMTTNTPETAAHVVTSERPSTDE
jgi:hypothetical protein